MLLALRSLLETPAQFTFVQKAWNSTAGGTPSNTTLSLPSVGAGHLVCVAVEYLGTSTGFTMAVTDGNGHSFILTPNSPFQYSTLARYIWLGYILSAAAGTMTITATPSVAHGISVHAIEFSYSGVAVFDKDAGAFSTTGTTPINTPSITPTNPNALLYAAAISDPAGSGTLTAVGSPWIDGTRGTIAADSNNSGDAYILGESGAIPVSWTVGSSSATGWNAAAMAFNIQAGSTFNDSIALAITLSLVDSATLSAVGSSTFPIVTAITDSALRDGIATVSLPITTGLITADNISMLPTASFAITTNFVDVAGSSFSNSAALAITTAMSSLAGSSFANSVAFSVTTAQVAASSVDVFKTSAFPITTGFTVQTLLSASSIVALGITAGQVLAASLNAQASAALAVTTAETTSATGVFNNTVPVALTTAVSDVAALVSNSLTQIGLSTALSSSASKVITSAITLGIISALSSDSSLNALQIAKLTAEAIVVIQTLTAELVEAHPHLSASIVEAIPMITAELIAALPQLAAELVDSKLTG